MAMTADQSHHSDQSPRSISSQNPKGLPSPWAQVVRGESDSVAPAVANHVTAANPVSGEQSTFSDCSPRKAAEMSAVADCVEDKGDNGGRQAKPVWKKPVNGVTDVSPVMGAVSWPALSESTKISPKSTSSGDSLSKILVSEGSISSPKGPAKPHSPHKQASSNAKPNATSNHSAPTRQRSMKRGGGSGHTQSNFSQPPPPPPPLPQFPLFPMAPNGYGSMAPPMLDQPPRGGTWEPRPVAAPVPPQPAVNDNRHSSRRGNFGPRGDGPFHNNFGGRRDSAQPQRSPRGFVRPQPPAPAPFVPPFPVRPPFANPMGFGEYVPFTAVPMEPFRGVPYMTHPPSPMMFPVPEPPLPAMLLHQIEYYFSDANLIRDEFLKSNMDDQGWVPITLIAGFNRVKSMTTDIQLILDSLRTSTLLEVQDEKVRRHADWQKWIPGSNGPSADSSPSSSEMLTNSLQKMTVEESPATRDSSTVEPSNNMEETPASQSEVSIQGECSETASSS